MPYSTGESPHFGDYVKNKFDQPGTVVDVNVPPQTVGCAELVSVRWDDGGPDSPLTPAAEFSMISRQS